MTITATFSPSAQLLSKLGTRIPSKARTRSHMASMADFYASLKRAADVLGQCALEETSAHTAVRERTSIVVVSRGEELDDPSPSEGPIDMEPLGEIQLDLQYRSLRQRTGMREHR
jgi:hypothetical protein